MGVSKFRSGALTAGDPTSIEGILVGDGSVLGSMSIGALKSGAYGVCSTAGGTVAKTVTVDYPGTLALSTGLMILVKFTNANAVGSPTLNVNGTGAVAIKAHGTVAAGIGAWEDGAVVILVYDGVYWQIAGSSQSTPFHVGTTAPSDTRKLWIDTNNGAKYYDGNAWVTMPVGYYS